MSTTEKDLMRLTPYNRTDGVTALGVVVKENLSTMALFVGQTITMEVVGIERKEWEGTEVR